MVNTNPSFSQEELKSFKDISFKLGSNSHLVQAAGGNTSIKSDGRMLIKASGTWLINSLDKDIFVEVDLNSITCLLYTSPSPRDATLSRMPSSA